jgi:hypothetical protein
MWTCQTDKHPDLPVALARSFSQSFHQSLLQPTRPYSTAIHGQPDLPRPYRTGLSGRLAVVS